jgi:hypothetical protein
MKNSDIILKLNQSIHAVRSSLDAVVKWSELLAKENNIEIKEEKIKAKTLENSEQLEEEKVIEGIFDGQNMIAKDETIYPVPTNYASKSKLVQGDILKLTIKPNGAFVYKQIELIPRVLNKGHLIMDGSQYKVLCEDKTYNVLYASVTFFRAKVGDEVAIIVPEKEISEWAAIENVIPAKDQEK